MKKAVCTVWLPMIFLLLGMLFLPGKAFAAEVTGEVSDRDVAWTFKDGTLTIEGTAMIGWSGTDSSSTRSGSGWWDDEGSGVEKEEIKKVVICDGIPKIGGMSFLSCTNLEEVTVPESVKSIGFRAFRGCTSLQGITLTNVTTIDKGAFYDCSSLAYAKLPAIRTISTQAFFNCSALGSVDLGSNTGISIGEKAFSGCQIKSLTLSAGVKLAAYSLLGCDKIIFAGDPGTIESNALSHISKVEFTDAFTVIPNSMFSGCRNLQSVEISGGVTEIGKYAFSRCDSLAEVVISKNVASIGDFAFSGCTELANVFYTGTEAEWNAISADRSCNTYLFGACVYYGTDHMPEDVTASGTCGSYIRWQIRDGVMTISGTGTDFVQQSNTWKKLSFSKVEITAPITELGDYSFYNCEGLKTAVLPQTVKKIGAYAFQGTHLSQINLPEGLETIGDAAFSGSFYGRMHLPSTLKSLGENVFWFCGLTEINIPKNLTELDFADDFLDGCYGLEKISVDAGNPAYDSRDNCNAVIDSKTGRIVYATDNTKIPLGVTGINDYAYRNTNEMALKEVEIPASVTYIGYGFEGAYLKRLYYAGTEAQWKNVTYYFDDDRTRVICGGTKAQTEAACEKVVKQFEVLGYEITADNYKQFEAAFKNFRALTASQQAYILCDDYPRTSSGFTMSVYDTPEDLEKEIAAAKAGGTGKTENTGDADKEAETDSEENPKENPKTAEDPQNSPKTVTAASYKQAKAAAQKLKVKSFRVKAQKGKKAKLTWKVQKKASGYQVQYSRKKNFKKAKKLTVKRAKKKTVTAKKLTAKKMWYFRIRPYSVIRNTKGKNTIVYGKWTKAVRIKAKA